MKASVMNAAALKAPARVRPSGLVYGSVCSGIEAASVAWRPLGWRAAFLSEIEPFPRAVLTLHHPEVPLHGDFTTIQAGDYDPVDILVGGTPCQSFSIAGLRGGLDDDRGNLALEYLRLADRLRPRWLVWENVPGVLSSNEGRDFGAILGGMVELGYGFAYRVLDAQFFGVAQRRRRVFVVGYLGDWRRAAAVLFERHSLQGHPAPRRETGQRSAGTLEASFGRSRGAGTPLGTLTSEIAGTLVNSGKAAGSATQQDAEGGLLVAHTLKGEGFDGSEDGSGRGTPIVPIYAPEVTSTLIGRPSRGGGHSESHANAGVMPAIAFSIMPMNSGKDFKGRETDVAQPVMAAGPAGGNQGGDYIVQPIVMMERGRNGSPNLEYRQDGTANAILTPNGGRGGMGVGAVAYPINPNALRGDTVAKTPSMDASGVVRLRDPGFGVGNAGDPADTLQAAGPGAVGSGSAVRRLTPRECERLQGFPDDYTLIPWRKGMAPDGPRYRALGNSMAVPVMAWIGHRIEAVEAINARRAA